MKIMAIAGSIRKGNTRYLVESSMEAVKKMADVKIEIIYLDEITMNFCNGCLKCDETGMCMLKDDMSEIVGRVKEADVFVFATPVRWGLLSGELKTFFDRLNPLAVREELTGKKAVVFAVGQSSEEEKDSIEAAAKSVEIFCENAGIKVNEKVVICDCYGSDDAKNQSDKIEACRAAVKDLLY